MNTEKTASAVNEEQMEARITEQIRQEYVKHSSNSHVEATAAVADRVQSIINLLTANKDHIGGFAINVMANRGTCLVTPEGDATDGLSAICGADETFVTIIKANLEDLQDEDGSPFGRRRSGAPSMAEMLAQIAGR